MRLLGVSAFYHDSAVALVEDGDVRYAAQEERFSRRKHDPGFPRRAMADCLHRCGLRSADLDAVVFYEKPFLKLERIFANHMQFAPWGLRGYLASVPVWMREKIFIKEILRRELGCPDLPVLFTRHHEAHAASAFFPSPFAEAAVLTVDGVGEWETMALAHGEGNDVRILKSVSYPHSLGLLYSAFTYFTGFKVNSGEYKLMGLAPYGEPVYRDLIRRELVDVKADGSFRLNLDYFHFHKGLTMTHRRFARLFGVSRRAPDSRLRDVDTDLAASVQAVTEEILERVTAHARDTIPSDNLCLAGGVALNCVANGRIRRSGRFRRLWIQPAAGDAGGALGAALLAWHRRSGGERLPPRDGDLQKGSLLGPAYSADEIRAFLDGLGVSYRELPRNEICRRVAGLIAGQKIVGFFQGRMEFGPRALGNRSILGDARSPEMQSRMNLRIKFRESFRPFAASVLAEHAGAWFGTTVDSPYMLLVEPVHGDRRLAVDAADAGRRGLARLGVARSLIPAVTHVDGSTRLQTVHRETNPVYHRLISEFHALTGCPVIINTSFNVRGEPIVNTPQDAFRCYMRTNLDALVLETFLLEKQPADFIHVDEEWMKEFPPD